MDSGERKLHADTRADRAQGPNGQEKNGLSQAREVRTEA
jgi:hypothetical protein